MYGEKLPERNDMIFKRIKLENFSTNKEEYQLDLMNFAQKLEAKTTLGAIFAEIHKMAERLSKTEDLGLKFLSSELKLLVTESELVRVHLVEPDTEKRLKPEIIGEKNKCIPELHRLYAVSDLPRAHDKITKFYFKLYSPALPKKFVDNSEIGHALLRAAKFLSDDPPKLRPLYETLQKYGRRILNEDTDLTFALNYVSQLFLERVYMTRPYMTRGDYVNTCKEFGKHLQKIALAIRKRNRIELFNGLYHLYASTIKGSGVSPE
jgi:hypothetical protein